MKSVSRRSFVRQCAGGVAAAPLLGRAAATGAARRPNILCLVSEDNGPFLGCYGDAQARTPHLDAAWIHLQCYRSRRATPQTP